DGSPLRIERAVLDDKPQRSFNCRPAADPCAAERSGLRPAPQAGTETRRFGRRGRREEQNIGGPGGAHRTDRTAVNTRGANAGIEPPVIDLISPQPRAIAFRKVQRHGHDDPRCRSLGPTPFWGWSPVLASDSGHLPLHLTAGI